MGEQAKQSGKHGLRASRAKAPGQEGGFLHVVSQGSFQNHARAFHPQ